MDDRPRRQRVRFCKRCGQRADIVPNPYFGSGLAIHTHFIICDHCGFTEFAPNPRMVPKVIERAPASRMERIRRALFRRG